MREETHCCHIGYSFRLAASVLLYASSHRQDNTYHSLCYTSRGALAGMRNSSDGLPRRIDSTTHCTMSEHSYHGATSRSHSVTKSFNRPASLQPCVTTVVICSHVESRYGPVFITITWWSTVLFPFLWLPVYKLLYIIDIITRFCCR